MSLSMGGCWGVPGVVPVPSGALGRGLFLGSIIPLEGKLLEMPLSGVGGKHRAAPPACLGFPGLLGHLLLVLLHPSTHPPHAPAGAKAAWARCSCR